MHANNCSRNINNILCLLRLAFCSYCLPSSLSCVPFFFSFFSRVIVMRLWCQLTSTWNGLSSISPAFRASYHLDCVFTTLFIVRSCCRKLQLISGMARICCSGIGRKLYLSLSQDMLIFVWALLSAFEIQFLTSWQTRAPRPPRLISHANFHQHSSGVLLKGLDSVARRAAGQSPVASGCGLQHLHLAFLSMWF